MTIYTKSCNSSKPTTLNLRGSRGSVNRDAWMLSVQSSLLNSEHLIKFTCEKNALQ